MRAGALGAAFGGILAVGGGWAGVEAATVSYYYVSGPGSVASGGPALNYGSMTLDASRAPGGTLANLQVSYRAATPFEPGNAVNADVLSGVDFGYGAGDLGFYDLSFDAAGSLSGWAFGSQFEWQTAEYRPWTVGGGRDRFAFASFPIDTMHTQRLAENFLAELGYSPDDPDYAELFCGSWAGDSCAATGGNVSRYWNTEFESEGGGQWFTDPLAFARQVAANTKLALANPPASTADIAPAPVPLPPAGLLLLGGMALLFVRRRRA